MKKNAFTLIELIAIITILAVIIVFSVPSLVSTIKKNDEKKYNDFLNSIYMAAENYIVLKEDDYPELSYAKGKAAIQIRDLVENRYITSKIINPKTNKEISDNDTIIITKKLDRTYEYQYYEGDYTSNGYTKYGLMLQYDGYRMPQGNIWKDISGNNRDATMVSFDESSGWNGDSIIFDGVDDYLDLGDQLIDLYKGSMTFEIVVKYNEKNRAVLLGNHPKSHAVSIEKGSKKGRIWYNDGALDFHTNLEYMLPNEINSYTFVFDKDNNTFQFYKDGVFISQVVSDQFVNSYDFLGAIIGADHRAGSDVNLSGEIHAVRVYYRRLEQQEIDNNHKVDVIRYNINEELENGGYKQKNLLAHYDGLTAPENNIWKDISGNKTNATMMNFDNNSWDQNGIVLDGIDDYLDLGNQFIDLYKTSMTFEILADLGNQNRGALLCNYPNNNNVNIEKNGLNGRIYYKGGNVDYNTPNNNYIIVNKPISYVFTLNKQNNTFSFYRNGQFVNSVTNDIFSNSFNFEGALIGKDNRSGVGIPLKGKIYAVRIYSRLLNDTEINENYQLDKIRYGIGD